MRLIDADALSEAMYRKLFETDDGRQRWDGGLWIRYKVFEEARDDAPTIDAEPVRHGRWEPCEFGDDTWHKCSVCGTADKYINIVVRKGFADVRLASKRNYCPICGAKMGEEEP